MLNRFDIGYCNGKPSYDKRSAVTARNKRWDEDHVELRVYQCPDCNWWHLTSLRARRKRLRHKL